MLVDPRDPASVGAFVRSCGLAVVATIDPAQRPEAALVSLAALDDGTLIFDAKHDSRKIENLRVSADVAVVVGWSHDVSLQIEGRAELTAGPVRDRFGREYVAQFPGSRALDEGFVVVTVRPCWLRAYHATSEPPLIVEASWEPSCG